MSANSNGDVELDAVAEALAPGGVLICYVATATQLKYATPASFLGFDSVWYGHVMVGPTHRAAGPGRSSHRSPGEHVVTKQPAPRRLHATHTVDAAPPRTPHAPP